MEKLTALLDKWQKMRSDVHSKWIDRFVAILGNNTEKFLGNRRILRRYNTENEMQPAEEVISQKIVDNSVEIVLQDIKTVLSTYVDTEYRVEATNLDAVADIKIGDTLLVPQAPIQFLLTLEKFVEKELSRVINAIPTLAPGEDWVPAEDQKLPGVYKWPETKVSEKSVKMLDKLVLFEPTEHHPGQAKEISKMIGVGLHMDDSWSGCLHPQAKELQKARLRQLLNAIKDAKSVANDRMAVSGNVGENVIGFVLTGKVNETSQ